ncbi:YfhO family protein [bacterium]|nr:YfhO family protein [bacterium]
MVGHGVDNRRHDGLAILLLAALACAFWGNCVVGGRVPVAAIYQKQMLPWSAVAEASSETRQWDSLLWDSMAQFYPWRLLLHRAAQSGELPLWNPYQFCGYPFVGNGQSAMFYPPNWLYFIVHPKLGMGLSAALHYFLGGLFVFGLGRAWRLSVLPALFAALAFSYGGFMVTWIELPTLPNSLIWLPLAWWGIEVIVRGRAVPLSGAQSCRARERGRGEDAVASCCGPLMLATALGMTLLAGHFQIAAYVWIFAFLYALVRLLTRTTPRRGRRIGAVTLAAGLGLMLAMAQLLPTLELGRHSSRGSGGPSSAGFAFHRQRAVQALELATLLSPDFLGSPVTGDYAGISYSEHCGFVGAITLLLGLAGLALKPRRGAAWLFGGIALFALWGAMAGPPAMLLYWGVPKLGQAGGFSRLLSVWTLAAALWGAMGLQSVIEALGLRASVLRTQAEAEGEEGAAADRGLKPPPGEPAADRPADGRLSTAVAVVALALLLVQVLPWAYHFNPRARAEDVYPETELIGQLRQHLGSDRYVAINDRQAWGLTKVPANVILPPNAATVYGLRCVDGYDSLFPARYREVAAGYEGADPSPLSNGNMLLLGKSTHWMGRAATLAVQAESASVGEWFHTVWRGEGCAIISLRFPLSRLPALLPMTPISWSTPVAASGDRLNASRILLPPLQTDAAVLVPDALNRQWSAWTEGRRPAEIRPGVPSRTTASVVVGAGTRTLDLVYFPTSVVCGLFVSLLALAAMVGLAAFWRGGGARG